MSVNLEIPSPATAAVSGKPPPKAGHSAKSGTASPGFCRRWFTKGQLPILGREKQEEAYKNRAGADGKTENKGLPAIHLQGFQTGNTRFYGSSSGNRQKRVFIRESGNNLLSQVSGGNSGEAALASAGSLK